MRWAVIADAHGNPFALQALLRTVAGTVDGIIHCGDAVGYFPFPGETVALLRRHRVICVRGNHDRYAVTGELPSAANRGLQWSLAALRSRLNPADRDWLAALPDEYRDQDLRAWHGRPDDCESYLQPAEMDQFVARDDAAARFNLFGHTHLPGRWRRGSAWYINPGSLAVPRGNSGIPTFARLDTDEDEAEICRLVYDRAPLRAALAAETLDEEFRLMLNGYLERGSH